MGPWIVLISDSGSMLSVIEYFVTWSVRAANLQGLHQAILLILLSLAIPLILAASLSRSIHSSLS